MNFYPYPRKKEQKGLPKKRLHLLLSCEYTSKRGGEKILDQRLEEKQKKKKKIPDQTSKESKREIYRKVVGPNNVWIMYRVVTSKKKRKETMIWNTWSSPSWLPTKSLCLHLFHAVLNKNKIGKEKAETPKAKFPTKNWKSPIDPWLHVLSLIW